MNTMTKPDDVGIAPTGSIHPLTFDDALRIARGCFDYGGGYRSNNGELDIYHHGIWTVINALERAKITGDRQIRMLHSIGQSTEPSLDGQSQVEDR